MTWGWRWRVSAQRGDELEMLGQFGPLVRTMALRLNGRPVYFERSQRGANVVTAPIGITFESRRRRRIPGRVSIRRKLRDHRIIFCLVYYSLSPNSFNRRCSV